MVIAFLNRLLRRHAHDITMVYEDKKAKREKKCHPKLVGQQQMSHRLKADLEEGKLSRVEFVTRHVAGGFEEKNRVVPITQTMVHKIVNAPTGNAAMDLLARMKAHARKHNFEEMQIRFRKTDTDQSVSPRFSTELDDAADAIYSRLEVLRGFSGALEQCPVKTVAELRKKMIGLLKAKDLWK